MATKRIPPKTAHWIVRRDDGGQRIPVRGPFSNRDDLAVAMSNARPGVEVQTLVYDQFGQIIPEAE